MTAVTHDAPSPVTYDVVHPGAGPYKPGVRCRSSRNKSSIQPMTSFLVGNQLSQGQKPQEAPAGLTKRLDSLDSDLKELRKLVEELQKAATTIIERQKSRRRFAEGLTRPDLTERVCHAQTAGHPRCEVLRVRAMTRALDQGQPGVFNPASDHGPVPGKAMGVHGVRAEDRRTIESAYDFGTTRCAIQRPAHRADTWRTDVEAAPGAVVAGLGCVVGLVCGIIHGGRWFSYSGQKVHECQRMTRQPAPLNARANFMSDPPTNIRALQSEQVLEITWPEGTLNRLPYLQVRSECPCATCRNEWTGERMLDPASIRPDLKLTGMENIGTYAVQFAWSDGHSSGIFTWETLRALGTPAQG